MSKTFCVTFVAAIVTLMVFSTGNGDEKPSAPARPSEQWEYGILTRSLVITKEGRAQAVHVLTFDHRGGSVSGLTSATSEDQERFQAAMINAPAEFVRKMFPNRRNEETKMRWEIDVLCALGTDGWELVQVQYNQPEPSAITRHYFKRALQK